MVVFRDDFERPSAASLGTAPTGQVWGSLFGSFSIVNPPTGWSDGQAAEGTGSGFAYVDLGTDQYTLEATYRGTGGGLALGIDSSVNNKWSTFSLVATGIPSIRLDQDVAGAYSALATVPFTWTQTTVFYTLRVEVNGRSVKGYVNGTLMVTATLDASFVGRTKAGLFCSATPAQHFWGGIRTIVGGWTVGFVGIG